MFLSQMPWHTVQYASPLPRIKFLTGELLHFKNKPIVVPMNQQENMENKSALHLIRKHGIMAFPFTRQVQTPYATYTNPPGPYQVQEKRQEYTFYYGGKDNTWIKRFSESVNVVLNDPVIQKEPITIKLSRVVKSDDLSNPKIQKLLDSFENEREWAMLTDCFDGVVSSDGATILKVLRAFKKWKMNVPKSGFKNCFKEYHDKL